MSDEEEIMSDDDLKEIPEDAFDELLHDGDIDSLSVEIDLASPKKSSIFGEVDPDEDDDGYSPDDDLFNEFDDTSDF